MYYMFLQDLATLVCLASDCPTNRRKLNMDKQTDKVHLKVKKNKLKLDLAHQTLHCLLLITINIPK